MYQPVQQCNHCGANLTLDHLRGGHCPYCKTVLPHRVQAAQHAELVGQVMGQMMAQQAQIQNPWRAGFGVGPLPPPPGAPGSPYADPARLAQATMHAATGISRAIKTIVIVSIVVVMALVILGMAAAFAFRV